MDAVIKDLNNCCRGIRSDKVTERKKNVVALRSMLRDKRYTSTLDQFSNESEGLTWARVFVALAEYIDKEIQYAENYARQKRTRGPSEAITANNREASNLFKLVIRTANKSEIRIKSNLILKTIMKILQNTAVTVAIRKDFCNVLLNDLLLIPQMRVEVAAASWQEMLDLFLTLYTNENDKTLMLNIIEKIVLYGSKQTTLIPGRKLFNFFKNVFEISRREERSSYLDVLMTTAVTFCYSFAYEYRLHLCKFGECVYPYIKTWWEQRPPESLKMSIIKFLEFQLAAHHPQGKTLNEHGAYTHDSDDWKKCLNSMNTSFLIDVENLVQKKKNNKSIAGENYHLPFNYLNLIAHVCRQVSNIPFEEVHSGEGDSSAAKRIKSEGPLVTILDAIKKNITSVGCISWLQILAHWFGCFPDSLTPISLSGLLEDMFQLLTECRNGSVLICVLDVCCVCVDCDEYLQNSGKLSLEERTSLNKKWKFIFDRTLRLFTLNQAKDSSLKLIKLLIQVKLIKPDVEIWSLFKIQQPLTEPLVQVLALYIQQNEMPKQDPRKVLPLDTEDHIFQNDFNSTYRVYLMNFLLRQLIDENGQIVSHLTPSVIKTISEVLVNTCLWTSFEFHLERDSKPFWMKKDEGLELVEIEKFYVTSTFNDSPDKPSEKPEKKNENVTVCLPLLEKLFELIFRDVRVLQRYLKSEEQIVYVICNYCSLWVYIFRLILQLKLISAIQICSLREFYQLELLYQHWVRSIEQFESEELEQLNSMMRVISESLLFLCSEALKYDDNIFIRKIIPDSLVNFLFKFLRTGLVKMTAITSSGDEFFDEPMEVDFDTNSSMSESNATLTPKSEGFQSLLDLQNLSPMDAVYIQCAKCLCAFNFFNMEERTSLDNKVKLKLIKLFLEDSFNINTAINLQLALNVLTEILQPEQILEEDVAELVSSLLRKVCKAYYKHVDVAANIFDIISLLLPKIPRFSADVQNEVLKLLFSFWLRQKKHTLGAGALLGLIKCMNVIAEVDPGNVWARWPSDKTDEINTIPISPHLIDLLQLDVPYLVQLEAANSVANLVKCSSNVGKLNSAILKWQIQIVERVKETSAKLPNPDCDLVKAEASINQLTVHITAITSIAAVNPFFEKNLLFHLIELAALNKLAIPMITSALRKVAQKLNFTCTIHYLKSHLDYLVKTWLWKNIEVEEHFLFNFPLQIFNFDSRDLFIKEYYNYFLPWLLITGNESGVAAMTEVLGSTTLTLVTKCFPKIAVLTMPYYAVKDREKIPSWKLCSGFPRSAVTKCYSYLQSTLTSEGYSKLLSDKLSDIIIELFSSIEMEDINEEDFPRNNPPSNSTSVIHDCLDFLKEKLATESVIIHLSKEYCLQNILLSLRSNVVKTHRIHERLRMFDGYKFFAQLLFNELASLGKYKFFVVKDVIHSLVYFVIEYSNETEFVLRTIHLLTELCENVLSNSPDLLQTALPFLVNMLSPMLSNTELKDSLILLFTMLLVENVEKLSDLIRSLDPIPEIPELARAAELQQNLKYSDKEITLEDQIVCFLRNSSLDKISTLNRLESLKFLKKLLNEEKEELHGIIQNLSEMPRFSEICQGSLIHQLINHLIYISSSTNSEIKVEAVRCLGEIGHINLYSSVLQIKQMKEQDSFPNEQRNVFIVKRLCNKLFDKDTTIVEAASSTLKRLLGKKDGQNFAVQYKKKYQDDIKHLIALFGNQSDENDESKFVEEETVLNTLNDESMWCPNTTKDYKNWITSLVCRLIEDVTTDEVLTSLTNFASLQIDFCEEIFPFVIHAVLRENGENVQTLIFKQINNFFERHCEYLINNDRVPTVAASKHAIKAMLSVINYLRLKEKSTQSATPKWDQNFWLKLNYLNVARAAEYCGANFSAMMFLQLWCDSLMKERYTGENVNENYPKTFDASRVLSETQESSIVYKLILNTYRNIGNEDGAYGFKIGEEELQLKRMHQFEYEMEWNKAWSAYSNEAESEPNCLMGSMKCLQMLGRMDTVNKYLKDIDMSKYEDNEEFKEFQYECLWKTCQWTLPREKPTVDQYNKAVYNVVIDLAQEEESRFTDDMQNAYVCVAKRLEDINMENTFSIYAALARAQMLIQMENFANAKSGEDIDLEIICKKWQAHDRFPSKNFSYLEPVLTNQCVLLQINHQGQQSVTASQILGERLLVKSKLAREAKCLELAASVLAQAKRLPNLTQQHAWFCEMEEARIFWEQEECSTAIEKIKKLLSGFDQNHNEENSEFHSRALGLFSTWLIETKSEIPDTIMQNLLHAITLSTQAEANSDLTEAYLAVGRYTDSNYQEIVQRTSTSEFESKLNLVMKSKNEVVELKKHRATMNIDQRKSLVFMEKQTQMDQLEINDLIDNKKKFLEQALKCYFACLKSNDSHNLRVFRIITLWFENQTEDEINKQISAEIKQIGSHKFVPLIHQLAARISIKNNSFQKTLTELIEKMCSEHPHHTLDTILALCNAYKDDPTAAQRQLQSEKDRVQAAEQVLGKLRKNKNLNRLIEKQKSLCEAFIEFSTYSTQERSPGAVVPIPRNTPLLKLPDLSGVMIPTEEIFVNPSGVYNVPHIVKFEPQYKLCGGINVPKVLTCLGSDGKKRTQLLKGQDDLHQDAVMQQVFGICNMLLDQNVETKKMNLKIRTYKIVPLSQRSGIVQWCEGTQPFGDCVISAHNRYHPNDLAVADCRQTIYNASNMKLEKKLEVYQRVCCKFLPAFHYFFFENFLEPVVWFERIQAYTKSVATSSIVGYVLGLGDRHVANILIDNSTAEVIHIDLGVAFDQGKLLPVPETVPFRLTRDIVDGMGITGIEGIFRKSCERTMDVLRQSQEIVTTLLQVLLYDPLYAWTLSPEKMAAIQDHKKVKGRQAKKNEAGASGDAGTSSEGSVNQHAERVLIRLQQKLQGIEGGSTSLSTIGQVNYLIKEASDPRNLCAVFAGWQPYL